MEMTNLSPVLIYSVSEFSYIIDILLAALSLASRLRIIWSDLWNGSSVFQHSSRVLTVTRVTW